MKMEFAMPMRSSWAAQMQAPAILMIQRKRTMAPVSCLTSAVLAEVQEYRRARVIARAASQKQGMIVMAIV